MSSNEGSCRCCLLVGTFTDMWQEHIRLGEIEIYGDMIKECFGVPLPPLSSSNSRDQICQDCITSLREALTFKEQILHSNQQLTEHMTKGMGTIEYLVIDSDDSGDDKCDSVTSNVSDVTCETADAEEKFEEVEYLEYSDDESDKVNDELPKIGDNNASAVRYTEEQLKLCLEAVKAGHLNQVQAAEAFNIPRQTICFRLQLETGDNYKEAISRWKKTQVKMIKDDEKQKENGLESVKLGRISMVDASIKHEIPLSFIKKALRREHGRNYDEIITMIKKKYVKRKRKQQEPKPKKYIAAKTPRPSKFTLMQAVTAVRDKKMSMLSASAYYNVRYKLLLKVISHDIDVLDDADLGNIFRKRVASNYTESELAKCVEIVSKGAMTEERASEVFHIPKSVISKRVIEYIEDEFTQEDCLSVVLKYTNAIPFKATKGRWVCAYCSIIIDNTEELRLHTQLDHKHDANHDIDEADIIRLDILDLKCVVCDKYIESWHKLPPHFEEHKIKIVNTDKIIPYTLYHGAFICALCEEFYPNFKVLDTHMNEHFVNYVCQDCGQPFLNLKRLRSHMSFCNDNKYTCDICGKEFNVKYNLRVHIEDHMRVLAVTCRYCRSEFGTKCERYVHIKKMHSEKLHKYPCKLCNKTFGWKPFYMSHYRLMHVKNSRYQCTVCREKFFTHFSLERHAKKHHVPKLTMSI